MLQRKHSTTLADIDISVVSNFERDNDTTGARTLVVFQAQQRVVRTITKPRVLSLSHYGTYSCFVSRQRGGCFLAVSILGELALRDKTSLVCRIHLFYRE